MEITSKIPDPSHATKAGSAPDVIDALAKAGDMEGAKAFASRYPQHAYLLERAFAQHDPGLLHVLQEEVPSAFSSPSPVLSPDVKKAPDPGDPGGPVDLPPVPVTPPSPPPAPPPTAPAPGGPDEPEPVPGGGGGGGGISTASGAHAYLTQNFDLEFIRDHEATASEALKAKIPEDEDGNPLGTSGVTIGYGVDLGQMSEDELQGLVGSGSINQDFADKISPYTVRKGSKAQDYLKAHPLVFKESDRAQLNALSDIRYAHILYKVNINYYNATCETDARPHFMNELPRDAKTAIADVAIQYGGNLDDATPHFWTQITHNQWSEAAANLHDFHDDFRTRRHADEARLRRAISDGLKDGEY